MTRSISSASRRIKRILSILAVSLCVIPTGTSSQEITDIANTVSMQYCEKTEMVFTGLWKTDKRATEMLMEDVYKKLLQGSSQDEALRLAKLAYLTKVNRQMLGPQYWAGFVLIGDNSPLQIGNKSFITYWLIFGSLFLSCFIGMGIYWRIRTDI